jgi:PTS system nitrogen regulatory IIA component
MPYRTLDLDEVASYLHLSCADIERLLKNQEIPFEKHGSRLVFRKVDIDSWASKRILSLAGKRLTDYHQGSSRAAHEVFRHQALLPERLRPAFIDPALSAKTKASVLREMALLAGKTGRVYDPEALLAGLQAREELCSTGVPGGLALLHPRHAEPFLFESPFIVLGRTVQHIPFGAPDGGPTDLFFLIGSPDDRLHLHFLARLCLMAQKTGVLAELRQASTSEAMYEVMINSEMAVLASQPRWGHPSLPRQ